MLTYTSFKQTDDHLTTEVSFSGSDDIQQIVERFKAFLLAIGYQPATIERYIQET